MRAVILVCRHERGPPCSDVISANWTVTRVLESYLNIAHCHYRLARIMRHHFTFAAAFHSGPRLPPWKAEPSIGSQRFSIWQPSPSVIADHHQPRNDGTASASESSRVHCGPKHVRYVLKFGWNFERNNPKSKFSKRSTRGELQSCSDGRKLYGDR